MLRTLLGPVILHICSLNLQPSSLRCAAPLISEGLQNHISPLKSNFTGRGICINSPSLCMPRATGLRCRNCDGLLNSDAKLMTTGPLHWCQAVGDATAWGHQGGLGFSRLEVHSLCSKDLIEESFKRLEKEGQTRAWCLSALDHTIFWLSLVFSSSPPSWWVDSSDKAV